jgi:hypothetical protein
MRGLSSANSSYQARITLGGDNATRTLPRPIIHKQWTRMVGIFRGRGLGRDQTARSSRQAFAVYPHRVMYSVDCVTVTLLYWGPGLVSSNGRS